MKLDRSTIAEYFELDFGGDRLTHYPSGDTCLRHQWMRSRDTAKWTEKLTEFLARHPYASIIANSQGDIIGDANSFPHRGGDFKVDDVVLVTVRIGEDDWGPCARTVVARRDFAGDAVTEAHHWFELDDGTELFWDERRNGWFAWRRDPFEQAGRARAPLEGEVVQTLEEKRQAIRSMGGWRF
ncbi:hypothetical protein OIU34_18435 [Pararhizobium sp. BT-229]|uniref:hypothetical protein n=1 Tax=Pararhizobium sp. BT-229 TaxID=2986923 RepID=UPI0021F7107A|nr:hypothetical protein [Pararhizobium sp. BT-229]MCV9963858.1 hypothetical protein [Pararhizobium sp. BT-229]